MARFWENTSPINCKKEAKMAKCGECASFFRIPEADLDHEKGKGDCVMKRQDQKGKFWLSKPVFESDPGCEQMKPKR
jgi:benzylsuccinate synthase